MLLSGSPVGKLKAHWAWGWRGLCGTAQYGIRSLKYPLKFSRRAWEYSGFTAPEMTTSLLLAATTLIWRALFSCFQVASKKVILLWMVRPSIFSKDRFQGTRWAGDPWSAPAFIAGSL